MSRTVRVPSRLDIVCACDAVYVLGRFVSAADHVAVDAAADIMTEVAAWCLDHQGPGHELVIQIGHVVVEMEHDG